MEQQSNEQASQKPAVQVKRSSSGAALTTIVGVLLLFGVVAGGAYVTVTYLAPDIIGDFDNRVSPNDSEPVPAPAATPPVSDTEQIRNQFKNALENVLSFHTANQYYPLVLSDVMGIETLSSAITYEGEDDGTTFTLCLTTENGSACVSGEDFPERAVVTERRDMTEPSSTAQPPHTTSPAESFTGTQEEAQQNLDDASARLTVNTLGMGMEIYYDDEGDFSYSGGCDALVNRSGINCHDSSAAYAAEVRLTNGLYYCVDSEGFSGTITVSKGTALFCQ